MEFFQLHILDPRSIASLRILLAVYILYDIFISRLGWSLSTGFGNTPFWFSFYTSNPESQSILLPHDTPHKAQLHQLWFYRGSRYFQFTCFFITTLLTICFGLGYKCRPNAITGVSLVPFLLWMNIVSMQNRAHSLLDGSDTFLRSILFWLMMIDISRIWSVDRFISNIQQQNLMDEENKTQQTTEEDRLTTNIDDSLSNHDAISGFESDSTMKKDMQNRTTMRKRPVKSKTNVSRAYESSDFLSDSEPSVAKMENQFKINGNNLGLAYNLESTTNNVTKANVHSSIATLGLSLQIVFMYTGTVLRRFMGSMWLYPELTAVYYALSNSFATKAFAANLVQQYPTLAKFMTLMAMLIESLAPISCMICPYRKWRHYPAFCIFLLHLGLFVMMRLPNWQTLAMCCCVTWIPTNVWDNLQKSHWGFGISKKPSQSGNPLHWRGWLPNVIHVLHDTPLLPKGAEKKEMSSDHHIGDDTIINLPSNKKLKQRKTTIDKILPSFFLFYMIYNWMGEHRWIPKHDNGDIGEALRISQHWVMFSPNVGTHSFTSVYTGFIEPNERDTPNNISSAIQKNQQNFHHTQISSHTKIDLYCSLQYDDWSGERLCGISNETYQFQRNENAEDMSHRYPSWRFERMISGWQRDSNTRFNRKRIQNLGRVICFVGNTKRKRLGLPLFQNIEMAWKVMRVLPPNVDGRFEHLPSFDTVINTKCNSV